MMLSMKEAASYIGNGWKHITTRQREMTEILEYITSALSGGRVP